MSRPGPFVLAGIDGSGKTTIATALVEHLDSGSGKGASVAYLRYLPFLLRPVQWLSSKTVLRDHSFETDYEDYEARKRQLSRFHGILARSYIGLLWFDYILQFYARYAAARLGSEVLVSDRYVADTVISDIAVDFDYDPDEALEVYRRVLRWFPRPSCVVYLDVPVEVSMQRKDDIPSLAYLRARKRLYDHFAAEEGWMVVDATQEIKDVVSMTAARVKEVFG